jgi:hypothetical protein
MHSLYFKVSWGGRGSSSEYSVLDPSKAESEELDLSGDHQLSLYHNNQDTFPIIKSFPAMSPLGEYKCLMGLIREHSYDNPATSPPDVAGKLVTQEQLDTKHSDYHLMAVLLGELGYEDVAAPGMVECHADFWTFAHFCVSSLPLLRESLLTSSRGSIESR